MPPAAISTWSGTPKLPASPAGLDRGFPVSAHLDHVHPQTAAPLYTALLQEEDEAVGRRACRGANTTED